MWKIEIKDKFGKHAGFHERDGETEFYSAMVADRIADELNWRSEDGRTFDIVSTA